MLNKELERYFTLNGISIEQVNRIEEECYQIAVKKFQGSQTKANKYLEEISKIAGEYYTSLQKNSFNKKNIMLIEIIKMINEEFKKEESTILEDVDVIIQFIKQLAENKDLSSSETYESILNSIKAFIICKRKQEIFAKSDEDLKIINTLLEDPTITAETLSAIIESLIIFANSMSNELEENVLQALNIMGEQGLKAKTIKPETLEKALDGICDVITDYSEGKISDQNLKVFFDAIIQDYDMYNKQTCTLIRFFQNIQENSEDILANSTKTPNKEKHQYSVPNNKTTTQNKSKFPFNIDPAKLVSLAKDPKNRKIAAIALGGIVATGSLGSLAYNHFTASIAEPSVLETEAPEESQEGETTYVVDDDDYFIGQTSAGDEETYGEEEELPQKPENFYDLPVHIYSQTSTDWGAHGPKEGTEVVAMADAYGNIYKISYMDENNNLKEITNPNQINKVKEYLTTDIQGFFADYQKEEFDIANSIDPSIYTLNEDYHFTVKIEPDEEMGDDEEPETEEENSENNVEITLKKGEAFFGYPIITSTENGSQIVIRYENSDGTVQDIPIMYFESKNYDYTNVMRKELYGYALQYTTEERTLLYDETHSKCTGIIEKGATIDIDFDGNSAVAKVSGSFVGYLDENNLQEKISEYKYLIDGDGIEKQVDENYPVSPADDQFYNAVRIPLDTNVADTLMQSVNEEKMPNTKFNEIQGTIIQIDPKQSIGEILKRINSVLKITGKPYGLECSLQNKEDAKKLETILEKIQKSTDGLYFQYGVLVDYTMPEVEETVYDYYWGQYVENEDYTREMANIEDIFQNLKKAGVTAYLVKTSDDNINPEKTGNIQYTLVCSRKGSEYTKEAQEYIDKLINAGHTVANIVDSESFRIAIDDETVNKGMKEVAKEITKCPEIDFTTPEVEYATEYVPVDVEDNEVIINTDEENPDISIVDEEKEEDDERY